MKLKMTRLQIVMEILTIVGLAGMAIVLFLQWESIPTKVPMHYNIMGEVDRWGNKRELISLPIIACVLYLLLAIITMFPSIWNMPVKITEENMTKVYGSTRTLLVLMKLEVVWTFFYLTYQSMNELKVSVYFLPIFLTLLFGPMILILIRIVKFSK